MKKLLLVMILGIVFVLITGCGENKDVVEKNSETASNREGVKDFTILEGDIFSEGKAWIKGYDDEGEFIGVIDTNGKLLFKVAGALLEPFTYEKHHSNFEQGVASVELEGDGSAIVDSKGRIVAQSGDDFDHLFASGGGYFIICKEPKGYQQGERTYAIMNSEGELSYPWSKANVLGDGTWEYYHSGMFVDGSRLVNAETNKFTEYKYGGFINITDEYIYFNNGKLRDLITCDFEGRTLSELDFGWDEYSCYQVDAGYLYVMFDSDNGKTRILKKYDSSGQVVMEKEINCAVAEMSNFSEGLCALHINGADGDYTTLMDTEGKFIFEPVKSHSFGSDIELSCGLFRCESEQEDMVDFIDMDGNKVISINGSLETVSNFYEGFACINSEEGCYYIDETGKKIF